MQSTDLCNAFEAITYIANGLLHMFNVHIILTDTELESPSDVLVLWMFHNKPSGEDIYERQLNVPGLMLMCDNQPERSKEYSYLGGFL